MPEPDWQVYSDLPRGPVVSFPIASINKTGAWRTIRPVVDEEKCIGCKICWKFCPDVAISMNEADKAVVNYDYCKGCGICAKECPKDAISMIDEVKA